jgi:hypothetical protein
MLVLPIKINRLRSYHFRSGRIRMLRTQHISFPTSISSFRGSLGILISYCCQEKESIKIVEHIHGISKFCYAMLHALPVLQVMFSSPWFVTSHLFGPDIQHSTLFSNTHWPCSSLGVRHHISHPHKTTGEINSCLDLETELWISLKHCNQNSLMGK